MMNLQKKFKNFVIETFICLFVFLFICLFVYSPVRAQTLGLSISPPISEIVIQPGKETIQNFTISNDGNDGMAKIYLIPFRAQGENGNAALNENEIVNDSSSFATWFGLISPIGNFNEEFYMAGGTQKNLALKISPPIEAPEKDYYFTLIFELDNKIAGGSLTSGSENRARIGSNILLSVSSRENPVKNLNIVEFSAPKIIDSLGSLNYKTRIGNYGSFVFQPDGKILVNPMLGKSESLSLAPQNVISDSIRNISCVKNEELVKCQSEKRVFIGVYKSVLSVAAGETGQIQEKTITTVAFPFSIIAVGGLIFATYRIIKTKTIRKKEST